jgi:hypothetical protein
MNTPPTTNPPLRHPDLGVTPQRITEIPAPLAERLRPQAQPPSDTTETVRLGALENARASGLSQTSTTQATDVLRAILTADPMFALQFALDQSRQGALGELAELAAAQQATNDKLVNLRKLEGALRDKLSRGYLSENDLAELEGMAKGLGIDLKPQLDALRGLIDARPVSVQGDAAPDGSRHIAIDPNGTDKYWQDRNKAVDDLKRAIDMHKDNVKSESSNRELDLQRATQDYSALMQQLSNVSRARYEIDKNIIGNIRG